MKMSSKTQTPYKGGTMIGGCQTYNETGESFKLRKYEDFQPFSPASEEIFVRGGFKCHIKIAN